MQKVKWCTSSLWSWSQYQGDSKQIIKPICYRAGLNIEVTSTGLRIGAERLLQSEYLVLNWFLALWSVSVKSCLQTPPLQTVSESQLTQPFEIENRDVSRPVDRILCKFLYKVSKGNLRPLINTSIMQPLKFWTRNNFKVPKHANCRYIRTWPYLLYVWTFGPKIAGANLKNRPAVTWAFRECCHEISRENLASKRRWDSTKLDSRQWTIRSHFRCSSQCKCLKVMAVEMLRQSSRSLVRNAKYQHHKPASENAFDADLSWHTFLFTVRNRALLYRKKEIRVHKARSKPKIHIIQGEPALVPTFCTLITFDSEKLWPWNFAHLCTLV